MMDLKEFFTPEELSKAQNVVTVFHGDILINNSLFDGDAVLVAVYMLSNKTENNKVNWDDAHQLYTKSGKDKESFRKAIYELTKRYKKGMIQKNEDGTLALTFSGLNHVKNLIDGKYNK